MRAVVPTKLHLAMVTLDASVVPWAKATRSGGHGVNVVQELKEAFLGLKLALVCLQRTALAQHKLGWCECTALFALLLCL